MTSKSEEGDHEGDVEIVFQGYAEGCKHTRNLTLYLPLGNSETLGYFLVSHPLETACIEDVAGEFRKSVHHIEENSLHLGSEDETEVFRSKEVDFGFQGLEPVIVELTGYPQPCQLVTHIVKTHILHRLHYVGFRKAFQRDRTAVVPELDECIGNNVLSRLLMTYVRLCNSDKFVPIASVDVPELGGG